MKEPALIIDLDGVIQQGSTFIAGALSFLDRLSKSGIPYMIVTNNSAISPETLHKRFESAGLRIASWQICTSGQVATDFISCRWPKAKVYIVGEDVLRAQVKDSGLESSAEGNPDCVLIAETLEISIKQLTRAAEYINQSLPFLSTNGDIWIPTDEEGRRLGCGAITKMLEIITGRAAYSLGKPNPMVVINAARKMGVSLDQVIVIGDSLDTDICLATKLGLPSVLVLSGVTQITDVETSVYKPSRIIPSVRDLTNKDIIEMI